MNINDAQPWIGWVGITMALLACALMGTYPAIGAAPLPVGLLHGVLLGLAALLVWRSPFAARRTAAGIFIVAVLARCLLLSMDHSGDVYRYAWEGVIQQHGYNPYTLPPDHESLQSLRTDWWSQMNHRDKTAIYPPVMMLIFRGVTALSRDPATFKALFILFDLAALAVLLSILRAAGRRLDWAWLYALNPVVLLAFASEAHLDAVMIFFTLVAVRLYQAGYWRLMFVAAALAFQTKFMALVIVPFLIRRDNVRHLLVYALCATLPFLAYWPITDTFATLFMFGTEMRFHGSIHYVFTLLLNNTQAASICVMVVYALYLGLLRLAVPSPLEALPYAWAALILLSPTIHFWYLTWLVPFCCLVPIRGAVWLCGTIAFSFATIGHAESTGEWIEFPWALTAIYLPVYAWLFLDLLRKQPLPTVHDASLQPVHTVGVIVPTLNEARHLPALLDDLNRQTHPPARILLCDGGSTDATQDIARARGVPVLQAQRGRGTQCAAGVLHTDTDIVFIAHADMRLPPHILQRMVDALNLSGRIGGAVGARFDERTPFLRVIETMNHLRARWFGLSFGDQGQFMRRNRLADIGGFPALPLMEDVEWSARMRHIERPLYLRGDIVVSTRRWQSRNPWRHAALVLSLTRRFMLYRLCHGHAPDTSSYYAHYHGTTRTRTR